MGDSSKKDAGTIQVLLSRLETRASPVRLISRRRSIKASGWTSTTPNS